jgi:hypothetical protein
LEKPMSSAPEPTGTLEAALAQTRRLLKTDPRLAAEQAKEILEVVPQHPIAILLLGIALRAAGETVPALRSFEQLVVDQPSSAAAHFELGVTLGACDGNFADGDLRFYRPRGVLRVDGGCALLLGAGLIFYFRGRRTWQEGGASL